MYDEHGAPSEDLVTSWNEHNAHADDYPDPADEHDETPELIGPLTAEEWCAFRQRGDDDLLQCCGDTSDFRNALFYVLRMGGDREFGQGVFRQAWQRMEAHGFPQGDDVTPLLERLRAFYIDPPATGFES
ncbi:hypothetical protein [Micromonospora sp. WMMD737]|uniref:hypothetical protein n=1 Tax=Micromonospora sp. WMMD737 TaxID=3404113 RepID=UPI003B95FD4C